jgi:hypothetical protein
VFVTTLLAVSLAAPVPKAKAADLYFPTAEGTKRVTQTTSDGQTTETTETVSKVAEKDGVYTVTTSRDTGGQVEETVVEVSAKGVARLTAAGEKKADPVPALKLPAKEGDTWEVERPGPRKMPFVTTYTVGQEEEVTVPAGKFKAIPVTDRTERLGLVVRNTSWYAPGVGVVKLVAEVDGRDVWVTELKEFTVGKGK